MRASAIFTSGSSGGKEAAASSSGCASCRGFLGIHFAQPRKPCRRQNAETRTRSWNDKVIVFVNAESEVERLGGVLGCLQMNVRNFACNAPRGRNNLQQSFPICLRNLAKGNPHRNFAVALGRHL